MTSISPTTNALGIATLVLVITVLVAGTFCVAYVLYFRWQLQNCHLPVLHTFNSVWMIRILLILSAMLWGLTELLRLPLFRHSGRLGLFHALGAGQQINLCYAHILFSYGISEPCYFLTALFLIQTSIYDAPFSSQRRWNQKVFILTFLFCIPLLMVQVFLVVLFSRVETRATLLGPTYFAKSYGINEEGKVVCTYPLVNTVALGLFSCVYNCCFLWQGNKLLALVINKALKIRIWGLISCMAVLLPAQILFMGMSVMSMPGKAQFDLMAFLSFFAIVLCIIVGSGVLVVQPIADALAVKDFVLKPLLTGCDDVLSDHYSVPLFVFGNEEDYYPGLSRKEITLSRHFQDERGIFAL